MTEYAIEVDHVYVSYRMINRINFKERLVLSRGKKMARVQEFQALKDISFKIEKGHTLGVIGPNGAGKSTLLKTLAGVFRPDSGLIKMYTDSISLLSLGAGFESELTGIQNIFLNGVLLGFSKKEVAEKLDAIVEFADIGEFVSKPIRTYSTGMRSRLAFAIAANVEPEILLLDEMLGVGDEDFRERSSKRIRELIKSHRTVVLGSHSMGTIRELCDVALWLDKGVAREFGEAKGVVNRYLDFIRSKRVAEKRV